MVNFIQVSAIILAGMAVAIADALIKKTATGTFWAAFKNPWMLVIILLYLAQIAFFVYVFIQGWKLGIVGILQMMFYSITIILSGYFIFGETTSLTQKIGMGLGLVAIVLMNI
jgi:drug/metabolite transporter (DMT)-like permease